MKKIFNSLFVIIASMVAFSACVKEENSPASETKTVQFFAESIETKTHFGDKTSDNKYPTLWDEGDKVKVLLNLESPSSVSDLEKTVTISEISTDFKSASFKAELNTEYDFPSYTFYAVVPSTAYNVKSSAEGRFTVAIPANQTPQEGSVDKAAQVLYAVSETSSTMPSSVPMTFKHYTAYGKLSLSNLTSEVSTVSSITLESAGAGLAGKWNYFVADGSVAAREGADKLTLTTSATENIWFACAPVDMSGKELVLTVNTDKGPLSKTITFPANHKFESGKISVFTVDMAGIEPEEPNESAQYYVKVTETPSDWSGKYLVVYEGTPAYWDGSLVPGTSSGQMGTTVGMITATITTNAILSSASVDKSAIIISKSGEGYALQTSSGKYFGMSTNNNGLKSSDKSSDYTHTITLESDKTVSILSSDGYTKVAYNKSSKFFRYYKVTTISGNVSSYPLPTLYKLVGTEGGETPDPEQPKVLSSIAISAEKKTEYYVGEAFVAPTVTATYEGGKTATVTATFTGYDLSEEGSQTVTVSYTENGVTKTAIYEITVSAAPEIEELTVEEFLTKEVSDAVFYQLSGTISNLSNTTYGNFDLVDGTATVAVYGLKQNQSAGNTSFANLGLKEGDFVTIIGPRSAYNGTPQVGTSNVKAYYVSHISACAAPTISCADNKVTITAETGATVYYTTDGATPTEASTKYTAPFDITETVTVKAIAVENGKPQSAAAELLCKFESSEPDAGEPVEYTLLFGTNYNSTKISAYDKTWYATNNGFKCTLANWNNNNNGWSYVKAGSKNYASVATITTSAVVPEALTTVTMTVDAVTSDKINSLNLYVSSDASFTTKDTYTATAAKGNVVFNISKPVANAYYKIEVDCQKGSSNGLITVSKVVYSN